VYELDHIDQTLVLHILHGADGSFYSMKIQSGGIVLYFSAV
jgi:hypothetical protein